MKLEKTNFYSIESNKDPSGKTVYAANITGKEIYRLKGLHLIPNISTCSLINIRNTNITMIETDDFDNLPNTVFVNLALNKNLSYFNENCFHMQNLQLLRFIGNNFNELPANVFNVPSLQKLEFANNGVQLIRSTWAIKLARVTALTLDEPKLTTLEPGWLNGLFNLQNLYINRNIDQAIQNQIRIALQNKLTIRLGQPPATLGYTANI